MSKSSLMPSIYTEEYAEKILSGTSKFEKDLICIYCYNLLRNTSISSPFAYRICHILETSPILKYGSNEEESEQKFPYKIKNRDERYSYPDSIKGKAAEVDPEDWKYLQDFFLSQVNHFEEEDSSNLENNVSLIADTLNLGNVEKEILTALQIIFNSYHFGEAMRDLAQKDPSCVVPLLARILNRPKQLNEISKILDVNGVLFASGILQKASYDEDPNEVFPAIDFTIREVLSSPVINADYLVEALIGKPLTPTLNVKDFPTYSDQIDHILKIIKNAVEKQETGINICFYGPAGVGKTELAKAIAEELDLDLYGVGEKEQKEGDKGKDSSEFRINKLLQAHTFLRGNRNSLLFFDEVEDLLLKGTDSSKDADTPNKILLNRLLEENPVVTIWAGNDIDKFHEAVRSRFIFDLKVDHQPTLIRKKIWERQANLRRVNLSEKDILSLARRFQAPARMITNALKLASLNGSGIEDIVEYMKSSSRLVYGSQDAIEPSTALSEKFDPILIGVKEQSRSTFDKILKADQEKSYSLLIQGEPGSGIVSIASYLAEKIVKNISFHDMRELLAEKPKAQKKIRAAFSQAADNKNMLLVNNLDAFSYSPKSRMSDWSHEGIAEIFVDCAYKYDVPMIASTYRASIEIPDFLRSAFVSHVQLDTLSAEQAVKASKIYLGREIENMPENLVPLDFSRVSRLQAKSDDLSDSELSGMLERQSSARQQDMHIGF